MIRNFLFPQTDNGIRDDFLWNTIAGCMNAAEAVILLAIVTRYCGIEQAGYLSIAFAVGNLFIAVGKFGVRNYQVTYTGKMPATLETYRNMRLITTGLMLLCCALYVVNGIINADYSWYKATIVSLMCLIYAIESMEDVYWGHLQRNGHLAAGAKMFVLRWGSIFVIVIGGILAQIDLLTILFCATFVSAIVYLLCVYTVRAYLGIEKRRCDRKLLGALFYKCAPLAIATLLQCYINNAPKYTIDVLMSDSMQAIYGYIAMPVFAVNLLSAFIFQPLLLRISGYWGNGEYVKFRNAVLKQSVIIIILAVLCITGAGVCGIQILGAVYGVNLEQYRPELIVIIAGGGLLAINGFLYTILTVMDARIHVLIGNVMSAVVAFFLLPYAIDGWGILGAAVGYFGVMFISALYFSFTVWIRYAKLVYKVCF